MGAGDWQSLAFSAGLGTGASPSHASKAHQFRVDCITAFKALFGLPYAGPLSDYPSSSRFGRHGGLHDGYDCSSAVAKIVSDASRGRVRLTPYTDAMAGELTPVVNPQPGDIVLYEHYDPSQPDTRYSHVALYLDAHRDIDCRYPQGCGIHPRLGGAYQPRYYRVPGETEEA